MRFMRQSTASLCLTVLFASTATAADDNSWFLDPSDPDWTSSRDSSPSLSPQEDPDTSWMFDENGELLEDSVIEELVGARIEANSGQAILSAEEYFDEEFEFNHEDHDALRNEIGAGGRDHNGGDACGIWLCLPIGFMTAACNGPRNEMIDRLFDGKSPAPSWGSCTRTGDNASDSNGFEVIEQNVAFIPPDRLVKAPRGCENLDESEIYRRPLGCVGTVKFSQIMQHGEPFGAGYYDIADGVIVDEREHCDIAEIDRHPSCFSMMPDDVNQEELLNKSPQMLFANLCPLAEPDDLVGRSWCWDHSENWCTTTENIGTSYCRTYENIMDARNHD